LKKRGVNKTSNEQDRRGNGLRRALFSLRHGENKKNGLECAGRKDGSHKENPVTSNVTCRREQKRGSISDHRKTRKGSRKHNFRRRDKLRIDSQETLGRSTKLENERQSHSIKNWGKEKASATSRERIGLRAKKCGEPLSTTRRNRRGDRISLNRTKENEATLE